MAPLQYLEQEYPVINSDFRHFCAFHGISSVEDFLVHDERLLEASAGQNPNSERLKQGIKQLLAIIDTWHQPWSGGLALLEDAEQYKRNLSTGSASIDDLLHGGFREGHLTELVGPSSSGKTQVCLQAAASVASQLGSVVFIDSANSFSPKRVAQFISLISVPANKEVNRNVHQVMKNVACHSVFDIFQLFDVLHQLKLSLTSQNGSQVQLLVVDSISSLIAPILGGSSVQGHALMVSVGYLLKELADKHNISVIVTNHMVGGEAGKLKPALGESWKNISHVRLRLFREHATNICTISILRHPSMASGKTVNFEIP